MTPGHRRWPGVIAKEPRCRCSAAKESSSDFDSNNRYFTFVGKSMVTTRRWSLLVRLLTAAAVLACGDRLWSRHLHAQTLQQSQVAGGVISGTVVDRTS